jgi:hypothetical protein
VGASRRCANRVSVRGVGGLRVRDPSSEGGLSSVVTLVVHLDMNVHLDTGSSQN